MCGGVSVRGGLTTASKPHRIGRVMPVQKVWLYVVRQRDIGAELLVFEHTHVDAGVQIPAGTVEPDEEIIDAAQRELWEESGIHVPKLHRFGEIKRVWNGERVHAHWFAGQAAADLPDEWVHHVTGSGGDNAMQFRCYWLPQTQWSILFGDFKLAYPALEEWISREFLTETK